MKFNKKKINKIKILDENFREILFKKKENKCFCCGSQSNLTIGHLITRKVYAVRWDFDNVEIQCRSCNFLHEYRPEIFFFLYIKKYSLKKFEKLYKKSKMKIVNRKEFIEEKIKEFSKLKSEDKI